MTPDKPLEPDGGRQYMAGTTYSSVFVQSSDELSQIKRFWWCPNCGAVFERHHRENKFKFCYNCEQRDGVLIECKPAGKDAGVVE